MVITKWLLWLHLKFWVVGFLTLKMKCIHFPTDDSVLLITNLGSISVSPGNVADAVTTVLLKQVLLSIGCAAASFSSAHRVLQEEGPRGAKWKWQ